MGNFVKVAQTSDIPAGQAKCVEVGDKRIAIFNLDGTFHAMDEVCPHQAGPLSEGEIEGTVVTCPWHGWEFDVTTGAMPVNPNIAITTYPVRVDGEDVQVEVP